MLSVGMNSYRGIATMLALTLVAAIMTTTTAAFAQDPQENNFGEGASFLGEGGQMGTHSSDPSGDGASDPDPRVGIGNVFDQGDPKDDPDSKHPADTADRLCANGGSLCP